jgi:3-oxoadipate CoA-transferase beta subunit
VAANGDLANWHTGARGSIPAVGGAMDLAIGAKNTYVMMTLFAKDGSPKLVPTCTYPLTGLACVSRVYTGHATFEITEDGVTVLETFGMTVDQLADRLALPLR